jgi:hypothetical protein
MGSMTHNADHKGIFENEFSPPLSGGLFLLFMSTLSA